MKYRPNSESFKESNRALFLALFISIFPCSH